MTSEIVSNIPQVDGRRSITERHTDNAGRQHTLSYLAETDADINAILALHAQHIADNLYQYDVTNEDGTVTTI